MVVFLLYCLNYAGCKDVRFGCAIMYTRSIALTMRDVKSYDNIMDMIALLRIALTMRDVKILDMITTAGFVREYCLNYAGCKDG